MGYVTHIRRDVVVGIEPFKFAMAGNAWFVLPEV